MKNKHKSSGNFLLMVGIFPIAMIVVAALVILSMYIYNGNQKISEKVEVEKEIIHDTVYVKCNKKHCDDIPKFQEIKKKKVESVTPVVEPTNIPTPIEPVENENLENDKS